MTICLLIATLLGQGMVTPDNVQTPNIPLFNQKPAPWVAPGRLFAVQVPKGWGIALHDNDPYTIDFRAMTNAGEAVLQVRRIRVPKGAHPRQIMMNAIERRLSKLPSFKIVNKRNVVLSGGRAAAVLSTYAYQGNLQFPRVVEELFLVVGTEAFIFHFECFEPIAALFAESLNVFYSSFQARPAASGEGAFATPQNTEQAIDPDKIPF